MLSVTEIRGVSLRWKKWSRAISEYISQIVNNMERNKEAEKIKLFSVKVVS